MKFRCADQKLVVVCFALLFLEGCVTTTTKDGRPVAAESSIIRRQLGKVGGTFSGFVQAITPKDSAEPIVWDWATGIPQSITKSETIEPIVPAEAVAAFAPSIRSSGVRLASTAPPEPVRIAAVNDTRVRTLADLHGVVEQTASAQGKKSWVVEFAGGPTSADPKLAEVTSHNLVAIAHSTLPDRAVVRVVEGGNPWILIKDHSVRCKVMMRKERQSDLVHLVVSLKVCSGNPVKLPVSLQVSCDGKELSCLNVSQTLGRLYHDQKRSDEAGLQVIDFSSASELDEYLIPINYRQLESKLATDQRLAGIRPRPAFAVVGDYAYPGPPVLGDARALSAFLLQPRVYAPDEEEKIGWVVFDGTSAPRGEQFVMTVDLGTGPQTATFRVPSATL